jgi:hypothetical protein
MKIHVLIVAGIMLTSNLVVSQNKGDRENRRDIRMEKMEENKKALISEKLKLTEQEALKFWPLYDEFISKMNEQRKDRIKNGPAARNFRGDLNNKSEKEIEEIIQAEFESEEAMLKIKREYHEKFKAQIGIKRTAEFYAAEMEYRRQMMRNMQGERNRKARDFTPGN